jgi:hypothetical protein
MAVELIAERFDADIFEKRMLSELGAPRELHEAEAAGIVIDDRSAAREREGDMIMR